MSRRRTAVWSVVVALSLAVSPSTDAIAHLPTSTWYPFGSWDITPDPSKNWKFTAGFPSGSGQRDSVREGADQWTNVSAASFVWNETAEVATWTGNEGCGQTWGSGGSGNNTIRWRPISVTLGPDPLAATRICSAGGNVYKFYIKFNSNWSGSFHWSGHTPDDVPSGEYDGWAVASHEFGHAVGFFGPYDDGHLDPGGQYCDGDLDHHTMCPDILIGKSRQRTLEEHDIDTFQSLY